MYLNTYSIIVYIFYGLLALSVLLLLYKIIYHIFGLMPAKKFPDAKSNHKYAILVPARYESNVIEELLLSIKNQDYPADLIHTYVIIESEEDPTYEICQRYENVHVFIRPDLNVKTKSGAMKQCFQMLLSEERGYEAYFIFDADNILKPDYIKEMNKTFDAGYKMALGYRNSKNWNDGWVAACSAIMFSMLNTFQNKCRARFNMNVMVSGTGFYIAHDVIKDLSGWPFMTLTEDYEISLYTILNNIKSTYNEFAEYLDEQPKSFKISWDQRIRWVKGFQQNGKTKRQMLKSALVDKKNRWSKFEFGLNIIPILVPIVSVFAFAGIAITMGIIGAIAGYALWWKPLTGGLIALAGIYLFFVLYTMCILLAERKHINITFKNAVVACLMAPFHLSNYIPIYVKCLFKKDVKWVRIDHGVAGKPKRKRERKTSKTAA